MTGRHVSRWWSPGGSRSLERVRRRSQHVGRAAVPPDTSDTATEEEEHRIKCVFILRVKRMRTLGKMYCMQFVCLLFGEMHLCAFLWT